MDIIGRALDDLLLFEADMGDQGFLDMVLRNACWQENRLLLRFFWTEWSPRGLREKRVTPGRLTKELLRVYRSGLEIGALLETSL